MKFLATILLCLLFPLLAVAQTADNNTLLRSQFNLAGSAYTNVIKLTPPPGTPVIAASKYLTYEEGRKKAFAEHRSMVVCRRCSDADKERAAARAEKDGLIFAVADDNDDTISVGVNDVVYMPGTGIYADKDPFQAAEPTNRPTAPYILEPYQPRTIRIPMQAASPPVTYVQSEPAPMMSYPSYSQPMMWGGGGYSAPMSIGGGGFSRSC